MAHAVIPHFANDGGYRRISIGAREFMCIGARAPFDHPHQICVLQVVIGFFIPVIAFLIRQDMFEGGQPRMNIVIRAANHQITEPFANVAGHFIGVETVTVYRQSGMRHRRKCQRRQDQVNGIILTFAGFDQVRGGVEDHCVTAVAFTGSPTIFT